MQEVPMSTRLPDSSRPATHSEAPVPAISDEVNATRGISHARLLLRIDGVFEALLGALLIISPATGLYGTLNLPTPASKPLLIGFGLLLLPLLPILWFVSRAPRRQQMLALAGANGAGSLVFALWVLLWNGAFNPAGATLVFVVAIILALLAALQARAALQKGTARRF
jgi:hypothetical protein